MSFAVALDAFESVKRAPGSAPLWQYLSRQVQGLGGGERDAMVEALTAYAFNCRDGRWLRCSALAWLTRDPQWLVRQAALVEGDTAPDAAMALLGLMWHQAIVHPAGRVGFVQLLRDCDAQRVQRQVAGQINPGSAAVRRPSGAALRVAIYTPQIASPSHGGTLFTLNMMSALGMVVSDIGTFTAQETSIPATGSYHGGDEMLLPLAPDLQSLKLHTQAHVPLTMPDPQFSLRTRFDQVVQAIDEFAPDVVVFVGLMSPVVYRLYERYPVLGLSVHALPPLAPVDVWLSADPWCDAACWPGLPVPKVFDFSHRFWPVGPVQAPDRVAMGLPACSTVLLSAGFRLDKEIPAGWRDRVLALLDARPDTHWLLIGVAEGTPAEALPQHPRVYRIAPQAQLPAWLAMADVYLNPPRIGGGGALAMAMEQGLASMTLADSDGGDKVGHFAVRDEAGYFAQLEYWLDQPQARHAAGAALKALFDERLDFSGPVAGGKLLQAYHLAIESFAQRAGVSDV